MAEVASVAALAGYGGGASYGRRRTPDLGHGANPGPGGPAACDAADDSAGQVEDLPMTPNGVSDRPAASPGTVLWGAQQIIRQHREATDPHRVTGRCKQCRPDGSCGLLRWAEVIVATDGLAHPHT